MVDYAEHLVSVAVLQFGVVGLGEDGGDLQRGLVIQLYLPVPLPGGQDVDVWVEAEAEQLSGVSDGRLDLPRVVVLVEKIYHLLL